MAQCPDDIIDRTGPVTAFPYYGNRAVENVNSEAVLPDNYRSGIGRSPNDGAAAVDGDVRGDGIRGTRSLCIILFHHGGTARYRNVYLDTTLNCDTGGWEVRDRWEVSGPASPEPGPPDQGKTGIKSAIFS